MSLSRDTAKPKDTAKPRRPNYGQIHAQPLPLDIFPLPPLIPHNPLSLLRIAYVYLSQLVFTPSSHKPNQVRGLYHSESNSVHVTDPAHIRLLWERGFFGKGSLSRSEPSWLDRERKRLGLVSQDTSEEFTQQRRAERKRMKQERAKKEREVIDETLQRERPAEGVISQGLEAAPDAVDGSTINVSNTNPTEEHEDSLDMPTDAVGQRPQMQEGKAKGGAKAMDPLEVDPAAEARLTESSDQPPNLQQQEHLQLSSAEAFFLVYALGILRVHDSISQLRLSSSDLLASLRSNSYFPPQPADNLAPDDPFLVSYVAYHHFRSLGWCVRPGIKFAVDWLLYLRGPAFTHAEFAVILLPAYRDDYWWTGGREITTKRKERRDWRWFHCLQRVQAQVRKGLVLCWIEIPSPHEVRMPFSTIESEIAHRKGDDDAIGGDIGQSLKKFKVREIVVKRWIPNRSRD